MSNLELFSESRNSDEDLRPEGQIRFENEMMEVIPFIVDHIKDAFERMHDELDSRHPDFKNHLSKSVRMHEQIKGLIKQEFNEAVHPLKYNRYGLFLGNHVILFKKLDPYGRPSNIRTNNSATMLQQRLNYPGEPIIIYVGYVVSANWENLKSIYAVSTNGVEVEWKSNLLELANRISRLRVESGSAPSVSDDDLDNVRARTDRNSETGT